jgi:hypothetical protein
MKRLTILFGILLITSNLFAQLFGGAFNYFYEKPAKDAITIGDLKANGFQDYLNNRTYSFFANDKLYMLSYEDMEFTQKQLMEYPKMGDIIKRKLYLYRLDADGWVIACDKPVMTAYVDHTSYISYFSRRTAKDNSDDISEFRGTAKNGSVTIAADGTVTIILVCHTSIDLNKVPTHFTFYNPRPIVLKPSTDGTYILQE